MTFGNSLFFSQQKNVCVAIQNQLAVCFENKTFKVMSKSCNFHFPVGLMLSMSQIPCEEIKIMYLRFKIFQLWSVLRLVRARGEFAAADVRINPKHFKMMT